MKNTGIIVLSILVFCAITTIFFLYKKQMPPEFNWAESYNHDNKEPYDYVILQELLRKNFEFERINKNLSDKLNVDNAEDNAYLFIGNYPYHSIQSAEIIVEFVKNGGEALIISNSKPDSILSVLDSRISSISDLQIAYHPAKAIEVSFKNKDKNSTSFDFFFKKGSRDTSMYNWVHIENDYNPKIKIFGSFKNKQVTEIVYVNFIGIKVGKGMIYWHTNPLLFTNLYLSKNNISGFEHLDAFFSNFKAKKWFWDHASVSPEKGQGNYNNEQNNAGHKTPMQYIFSQPALKLAWLILIIATILYGLFGAKRRQQHIPIVEANKNNSLEFVNTIGLLYYQQQNHKVIFEKIMQLFKAHLRRKYGLILKEDEMQDAETITHIVKRTDINETTIREIFDFYLQVKSKLVKKDTRLSSDTLNKFYVLIDNFYKAEKNRKSISKSTQKTV